MKRRLLGYYGGVNSLVHTWSRIMERKTDGRKGVELPAGCPTWGEGSPEAKRPDPKTPGGKVGARRRRYYAAGPVNYTRGGG